MFRAALITAAILLTGATAAQAAVRPALPTPMPTILRAPCPDTPDAMGCTDPVTDSIYLPREGDHLEVLHEIGHIVDARYLTDPERAQFKALLHLRGPWTINLGEAIGDSRYSPGEQFADAYAHCHGGAGPEGHREADGLMHYTWWSSTPFEPSLKVYRRVCGFIARAMLTPVSEPADSVDA